MTVSNFNSSTAFPRLMTAPQSMPLSSSQNSNEIKKEEAAEKNKKKTIKEKLGIDKMSEKEKYWLGASSLAVSAIAGILIAKSGKKGYEKLKDSNSIKKFLEDMNPEFDPANHIESTYSKGYKRIDKVIPPAGLNYTEFLTPKGKTIASVYWDFDNKVISYVVKDKNGNVLKSYNS